jgi:hypothetical protein
VSRHEYETGIALDKADTPFYGLVMAGMLRADTYNLRKLVAAFPETYAELDKRYWAPGGVIEGDPDFNPEIHRRER